MRKSKINKILIGLFLLLAGCNGKKPEIKSGEIQKAEIKNVKASEAKEPTEGNLETAHTDFDLKEIPVVPKNVDVPEHIAEVNLDVKKITSASANPARKVWDKYFQIAITQQISNEVVPVEVLWDQLSQKLRSEKLPALFYRIKKDESIEMKKGLYGLYLASFISSVEGGGALFDFIEERASDKTVKKIDLDLFKILISGMTDVEGRLDKMSFNRWGELSKSFNPVYKMLAIQIGDRLFEEGGIITQNLSQSRLKYYEAFLKDDSKKLRIEALKGIRNLGNELALPVLDQYLKGEYGETDRIEAERVFKR
jgi:hypothetical protein